MNVLRRYAKSLVLAALLLAYVGTYMALVRPTPVRLTTAFGSVLAGRHPNYRLGGSLVATLLYPVFALDRHVVRPDFWSEKGIEPNARYERLLRQQREQESADEN